MPLPSMMPGTIKNPPPIPKKPEKAPTIRPIVTRRAAIAGVMLTEGSPSAARGRNMAMPTAIIASANRNNSLSPATSLPIEEPIAAPAMPAAANVAAHGHFTLPARQWPLRLAEGIERDGKRARADGDMRIADAGDVKEERHGEY